MSFTDAFGFVAGHLEVSRLENEAESRSAELINSRNLAIVEAGQLAVANGEFDLATVHAKTWDTVNRHREMMRSVGYGYVDRPELTNKDRFDIPSQKLEIAS